MIDDAMEPLEHPDEIHGPDSGPAATQDGSPAPGDETDVAPAAAGTRSDHAGSAPQSGSGASETGPAPTAGEGEHLAGDDPQTEWLRDAPGDAEGAKR